MANWDWQTWWPQAEANPWGGATLEWQISSPPPHENFEEIPVVTGEPYVFDVNPEQS